MSEKTYNFQDPALQQKASAKARLSVRPKTYRSKSKRVDEAKKELIKEELLKEGFLQQIGAVLPRINAALIASALQPNAAGASDRKIIYSAVKILNRDKEAEKEFSMGQILAELAQS